MIYRGVIIGFGNIAVNGHLPAYRQHPHIEITAVMDALPSTAGLCRDELPQSAFYSTVDELLDNEDVDFVDIATPPGTHAELICKALGCGKHVLCEKPLVLAAEDLENDARLQKNVQKAVFTVHNWRYAPIFQKVSELLVGGGLGEVRNITYEVIRARPSVTVGIEIKSNIFQRSRDVSAARSSRSLTLSSNILVDAIIRSALRTKAGKSNRAAFRRVAISFSCRMSRSICASSFRSLIKSSKLSMVKEPSVTVVFSCP